MKLSIVRNALFLGLLFFAAGCFKDPEPAPCTFDPCGFKAPATEIQQVKDYLAANNLTATEHCSGLFYRIENAGTGLNPGPCNVVDAHYKGMLSNGEVFEENTAQFGLTDVIAGWTIGVPMIKQGGRIVLYIPPSLAYGSREVRDRSSGALVIPANSMLVFEIDLLKVY